MRVYITKIASFLVYEILGANLRDLTRFSENIKRCWKTPFLFVVEQLNQAFLS